MNQLNTLIMPLPITEVKTNNQGLSCGKALKEMVKGGKTLSAKHRREWIEGSGISSEITEKCLQSIDDRQEIAKLLGWKGYPEHNPHGWFVSGISLLTFKPLPFGQFKPDTPIRLNAEDDKLAKYLTPKHIPYDAIALDVRDWAEVVEDPTIHIAVTEGVKKVAALETCEYPSLALVGVNMGLESKKRGLTKVGKLVPNMDAIAVKGRPITFIYDADIATKPEVQDALINNATATNKKGAIVYVVPPWDISLGKGIDDVLANHGPEKLTEIMNTAIPYKQWLQSLERQLKKEPLTKSRITPADIIAREIAEEYRSELAYNNESGQWMKYESESAGVWTVEKIEYIESIVYQILTSKGIEGYNGNTYISNIVKILRHQLIVKKWQERSPNELIPFQNGVLEVATGKLLPHSPGYRFTWAMPREHDPLAKNWATIDNFLTEATGNNPAIKDLLICFCNAVMKGRSDLQKFLHLTGPGGSGKGTFLRLLNDLIGQNNTHSTSLSDWCSGGFETFNAYKKRLIIFPDEDKKVGNLGRFKSLTGGDFLRGEEKRMTAFNFKYEGMVVLASNFPIFQGDNSSGMTRRTVQVRFGHVPTTRDRKDLNKLFQPELSAFINHLLTLSDDMVSDTILNTGLISELNQESWEYQMRSNNIAAWFSECVIYDPLASTQIGNDKNEGDNGNTPKTLFGSYCQYAKNGGTQLKSVTNFSPDLIELCSNILKLPVEREHTRNGKVIKGLRLRTLNDNHIPTYEKSLCDDPVTTSVTTSVTTEPLTEQGCDDCDDLNEVITQNQNLITELEKNNILAPTTPPQVVTLITSETQQPFEVITEPITEPITEVVTVEPVPEVVTEVVTVEPVIDFTSYPHLTSNDYRAKEKQASEILFDLLACTNSEELISFKSQCNKDQLLWVYNHLTTTNKEYIEKIKNISQLELKLDF